MNYTVEIKLFHDFSCHEQKIDIHIQLAEVTS